MLNMDFSKKVVLDTNAMDWLASPKPGVWRKPLAREDAESGHATSIVKYEPGASFDSHNHPWGEEILVLEGTFSDATGDFHAGTYFRNPKGFVHAPFSKDGCIILVKLHQFQKGDSARIAIDTNKGFWQEHDHGIKVLSLHTFGSEQVDLIDWPANTPLVQPANAGGEEVYVLKGELKDDFGTYPAGTWMRLPPGHQHHPYVEKDTLLWVKTGHLQ